MKTSDLIGPALDWAVAKCSGDETRLMFRGDSEAGVSDVHFDPWHAPWSPSTDWSQGGPIIERERIRIDCPWNPGPFEATCKIDGVTGW